jgi:hypothetical protein
MILLSFISFILFYAGMLSLAISYRVSEEEKTDNKFSYRDCNAALEKERESLLKNIFRILFSPDNKLTMGRETEGLFLIGQLGADFPNEYELVIEKDFDVKERHLNQAYNYVLNMKTFEAKAKYNLGDWDMINQSIPKDRVEILNCLNCLYLDDSYRLGSRNHEIFSHIKNLDANYQYKDGLELVIGNGTNVIGEDVVKAWKFLNKMLTNESKKLYNLDNWEEKVLGAKK